ncbi:MAG: hypothetical protein KAT05_12055, partial [Spirochaetes bacterium]|nr:hypothetical protein [Spirochaetota bacterium]
TYTKNIGRVGCALSSLSTLVNYYAETFPELNISTTNPKILNDIAEYYALPKRFNKNHDLNFLIIESTNVSNGKIDFINDSPYKTPKYTISKLRDMIDGDLKKKLPVIAVVRRENKNKTQVWKHFITIVGKCGNKYVISDPGNIMGQTFTPENTITLSNKSTAGPLMDIRRFKKR